MKEFEFLICTQGQVHVHHKRCPFIKKAKAVTRWVEIAPEVGIAIENFKQQAFEVAGGDGDYKTADKVKYMKALEGCDHTFVIFSCAKNNLK